MEDTTEKSESNHFSHSYWDKLPSYSPCCSYQKVDEQQF